MSRSVLKLKALTDRINRKFQVSLFILIKQFAIACISLELLCRIGHSPINLIVALGNLWAETRNLSESFKLSAGLDYLPARCRCRGRASLGRC